MISEADKFVYAILRDGNLYAVETSESEAQEKRGDLDVRFWGLFTVEKMKLEAAQ